MSDEDTFAGQKRIQKGKEKEEDQVGVVDKNEISNGQSSSVDGDGKEIP